VGHNTEASQETGTTGNSDDFLAMGLAGFADQATAIELDSTADAAGRGLTSGANEVEANNSSAMGAEPPTLNSPSTITGQPKWTDIESALQMEEGYQVQYEYNENSLEPQRSPRSELFALAEELWRADPELEIYLLDTELHPITKAKDFPTSSEQYMEFFSRITSLKNDKLTHIFGFYLSTKYPIGELIQLHEKSLKQFLIGHLWLLSLDKVPYQ
jgi:hypothetical protein